MVFSSVAQRPLSTSGAQKQREGGWETGTENSQVAPALVLHIITVFILLLSSQQACKYLGFIYTFIAATFP